MKILHTSDWHLGRSLTNNTTYIEDQKFFFEKLYGILSEEHIDAVICAGDVYDSSVTNAEAIRLYDSVATKICAEMKIPMIVIAGNHDSGPRLAACSELLKEASLHVYGRLGSSSDPILLDNGRTAVYPLPYFNKDEAISIYPEKKDEITNADTAMKTVCDEIRRNMNKDKVNIIVSHSLIINSELSESDHSAQIGTASAISKDVFEGFDYVALGHIHKAQAISENIRYSGSPIKYSFGKEEYHKKGVVIIDTENMSQKFVEIPELHGHFTLNGTYDELIAIDGHKNDYIRIQLTDRFCSAEIRKEFEEKFPLMLEAHGKEYNMTGGNSSITASDTQRLDEFEIMTRFMKDYFEIEPDEEQKELFRYALLEEDKEVEEN